MKQFISFILFFVVGASLFLYLEFNSTDQLLLNLAISIGSLPILGLGEIKVSSKLNDVKTHFAIQKYRQHKVIK